MLLLMVDALLKNGKSDDQHREHGHRGHDRLQVWPQVHYEVADLVLEIAAGKTLPLVPAPAQELADDRLAHGKTGNKQGQSGGV